MAFDFHPFLCTADERSAIASRLAGMEDHAVYEICINKSEPLNTRFFGALGLPPRLRTQLLDSLILDCDDLLWTALHKLIPPTDTPQLRIMLRRYFDECIDEVRISSIHILAKLGDEYALTVATDLLASHATDDRVLAVACLAMLGTESALESLRRYWRNPIHPLDTRVQAAGNVLRVGDPEPLPFLLEIAEHDCTVIAYQSLMKIYNHHDKRLGLQLMYRVLCAPEHGSYSCTLRHVSFLMGDPSMVDHPEGATLARKWIESRCRE